MINEGEDFKVNRAINTHQCRVTKVGSRMTSNLADKFCCTRLNTSNFFLINPAVTIGYFFQNFLNSFSLP